MSKRVQTKFSYPMSESEEEGGGHVVIIYHVYFLLLCYIPED